MEHELHDPAARSAAASKLLEISVPTALGGQGRPWTAFVTAFQASVATDGDLGYMMQLAGQAWAAKAILDHGSDAQQRNWIPKLLNGSHAATALAEPQSGSDMRDLQTRLTLVGQAWRLDGEKRNISLAAEAPLVICLVQTLEDRPVHRLVLLDCARHTWQTQPSPAKIGLATLPTADMHLQAVPISDDDLLAPAQNALSTLADFMTFGRSLIAFGVAAALQKQLQSALQFAQTRQSGGAPIATHQYVQAKLTDLQLALTPTRLLAEATLQAHLAQAPEALALGSMAKITASQALATASQHLMSIYGTTGFQEGPVGRFIVDALAFQAIGGTEEVHRLNLFKQMQRGPL
jgi:alkylation response protein AidB-like acyl-CoA dehydrogenase